MSLPLADAVVVLVYVAGVVAFGCWFVRRSGSTSEFIAAGGRLPGWAVGLSIFGTFLSSNTFIGVPGKVYGGNWNYLVFSLSLPLAAWVAVRWFVPFYRRSGDVSAYSHLEQRFGPWARLYMVACYLLTQLARVGTILFGVSLALHALLGWDLVAIIVVAGLLITLYTLLGGIEAVIWTDVVQSLVLIGGAILVLVLLLVDVPGGPARAVGAAWQAGKFGLGGFGASLTSSTFWVVLAYGLFINLGNFGIDQSYVQRYHAARDERQATRSVWLGALLYLPVSLLFFLIGSCLFSYYQAYPESEQAVRAQVAVTKGVDAASLSDADIGDQMLPRFIAERLRGGLAGLLIAAILAATMSSVDTSLNSSATILLRDVYLRYVRPGAGEAHSLRFLRGTTLLWGLLGTGAAVAMIRAQGLLDAWWQLQGIFAGGMLGLFLLGLVARRADGGAALAGLIVGVLVIAWATFSPKLALLPDWLRSPLHTNLTIVVGTMSIFLVGLLASRLRRLAPLALLLLALPVRGEVTRVEYRQPGLTVDLGVGLWAWPLPMDFDGDGDLDLLVACPDVPYNGVWYFENPGGGPDPVFRPAVRISAAVSNLQVSEVAGRPVVLSPGKRYPEFIPRGLDSPAVDLGAPTAMPVAWERPRANQWKLADLDGDGAHDLIVGVGYWSDYGWDNAFDALGNWIRGPLHGLVFWLRNNGTDAAPTWAKPVPLTAAGEAIDVYGMPSPCLADFDGDGDLDLLCGEFVDSFTYFANIGTTTAPEFAAARTLPQRAELCMITPTAVDWDGDGDADIVCGEEDGRVCWYEHTGALDDGLPVFAPARFFRQEAEAVKFGALVTPWSVDWDGDGDDDLIAGNTAGYLGFMENLDGGDPPRWAPPVRLTAGGETIRLQAGPNGSIQGPCERKWGYTTVSVADWDGDGRLDIIANSIWGRVQWYRRGEDGLDPARPVEVAWPAAPPKPAWTWWTPAPRELATQWRTTPVALDWDGDGACDLVVLDHEGYLTLFRRDGELLQPGERMFVDRAGAPLRLNANEAGRSGRRKLCWVDWDGDGDRDLIANSRSAELWVNEGEANGRVTMHLAGDLTPERLAGHTTSPTVVDWNRDGVPELLIGAEDGHLYHLPHTMPAVE